MPAIDMYQEFLRLKFEKEMKKESKRKDYVMKIIRDINNRILPGISDILSTYQDDQNDSLRVSLVDDRRSFTSRGNLYIVVYCDAETIPIINPEEITRRILLEFGDDIKFDDRHEARYWSGTRHIDGPDRTLKLIFLKYIDVNG